MQVSILNALKSSSRIEAVFSFVETTAPPDHLPLCSYITIACRSVVAVCAGQRCTVSLTLARNCFYSYTVHESKWSSGRLRKLFRVVTETEILSLILELKLCLLHFTTKVPLTLPPPPSSPPPRACGLVFPMISIITIPEFRVYSLVRLRRKSIFYRNISNGPSSVSHTGPEVSCYGQVLWATSPPLGRLCGFCPPHPALPWVFWNSSSGLPPSPPSFPGLHHLSSHPKPALVSLASVSSLCRHPSESQREGSVKVGDGQGGGLGGPALWHRGLNTAWGKVRLRRVRKAWIVAWLFSHHLDTRCRVKAAIWTALSQIPFPGVRHPSLLCLKGPHRGSFMSKGVSTPPLAITPKIN